MTLLYDVTYRPPVAVDSTAWATCRKCTEILLQTKENAGILRESVFFVPSGAREAAGGCLAPSRRLAEFTRINSEFIRKNWEFIAVNLAFAPARLLKIPFRVAADKGKSRTFVP